jgi:hypothetical protein
MKSRESASQLRRELERCDREIQEHEANLLAGHPDIAGLLLALSDWRTERRLVLDGLPRADTEAERDRNRRGAAGQAAD